MKTVSALLYVALPKVLAGGGQFLLNLFLLRYFGPVQFGAVSVCLTAILFCDAFLGSAIDMGILRLCPSLVAQDRPQRSLQIQLAGLMLKPAVIGLLILPISAAGGALSLLLFQRRDQANLVVLTMLALLGILMLRSVQTYFQVQHRFNWYGGADLAHNLLRYGLVAIAMIAGIATPARLLATYALAPFIVCMCLLAFAARDLLRTRIDMSAARELCRVLIWFVPTALVGGLTTRMDVFFVSSLAGVGEAGIFTAAQAMVMPAHLLGAYLAVVFGPRIMPQFEDGSLGAFYRRFQGGIILLSIACYVLAILGVAWVAPILFPPAFQRSAAVLTVLLPAALCAFINFPLTISLLLFLKPKLVLAIDAVAVPFLCVAYSWTIPRYGAAGAAAVTALYALLKTLVLQAAAWRLLKTPRADAGVSSGGLALLEEFR
jgi:O-antigen/teichoic acid export membrane protein